MPRTSVIHRYLDPADALGEVLFGLIMVLTLTIGVRFVMVKGQFDTPGFVTAVIGGNVAWGVIDGVLYALGSVLHRSRRARFFRTLRGLRDRTEALAAIQEEFGIEDAPMVARPEDRDQLHHSILALTTHAKPVRARLLRDDVIGGLIVCALVSATVVPGVVPFLVLDDPFVALRASNLVLVLLLFLVGYWWARVTETNPWATGLTVMVLGVAMVGLAVALGG
jgi:VIT1/CCC1 family predicted Fe2+/Mn2+ transporter